MTRKDPNQELLEAYINLLDGNITYDGSNIPVGTRIGSSETDYIHLYIEEITDHTRTGDQIIYEVTVAFEIISVQSHGEIDDTPINSIMNDLLSLIDEGSGLSMTNFNCALVRYGDMDYNVEETETNNLVYKIVRVINVIEQTT